MLLPRQMVIETDADFLPGAVRAEFESKVAAEEGRLRSNVKPVSTSPEKKSKSFLSLQGIGEALFGSSGNVSAVGSNQSDSAYMSLRVPVGDPQRWDAGYEDETDAGVGTADDLSIHANDDALLDSSVNVIAQKLYSLVPEFEIPPAAFYYISPEFAQKNSSQSVIESTFKSLR